MKNHPLIVLIRANWDLILLLGLLVFTRVLFYITARPHWQDLISADTAEHFEVVYGLDRYGKFAYSNSPEPYGALDLSLRVGPLYPVFLTTVLKIGNCFLKEPRNMTISELPGKALLPRWKSIVSETVKVGFTTIHYDLVIITNIFLSLFIGILIFYLAKKYVNRSAGLAALLFYALDPPSNIFTVWVITEILFVFIFLVSVNFLLISFQKEEKKSLMFIALSGFFISLAALCRVIAIYFFVVVFAVLLFYKEKHNWKWFWKRYLFWNFGFLPLIILWILRNYLVVGMPVFETISSRNLLLYRATGIMCEVNGLSLEENKEILYTELNNRIKNLTLNPGQYAEYEKQSAIVIFKKYPLKLIKVTILSFIRLMVSPGRSEIGQVLGYFPSMLIQHNEVIHFYRYLNFKNLRLSFSNLKESMIWVIVVSWSYLAVLYVCTLVGIFNLWKINRSLSLSLISIFLYFAILSSGPESVSRFRVPFIPIFCIFAGLGINIIVKSLKQKFSVTAR